MQLVQTDSQQKELPELIPLSKFNEYIPYPTVAALRQYYFYGHKNGFINVVKRIGKRIYIDINAYKNWVNNNSTTVRG